MKAKVKFANDSIRTYSYHSRVSTRRPSAAANKYVDIFLAPNLFIMSPDALRNFSELSWKR